MRDRLGLFYTVSAYLVWGGFPAFFVLLNSVDTLEIVPIRTLWALVFALIIVVFAKSWAQVRTVFRTPRLFWFSALAGGLLYLNWTAFVFAVQTDHIIETSLGYFINPFVTIALGVLFRGERLSRLQWVAVSIAAVAVIVLSVGYGQLPWIALTLAFSFGLYGFIKKQHAEGIDAPVGMFFETVAVVPIVIVQLVLVQYFSGTLAVFTDGLWINVLLALSGLITLSGLLLFAAGTKRLPLIYVGFIQFLSPVLTFLFGYFVMGEDMSLARWIGFVAVWAGIAILLFDIVQRMRSRSARRGSITAQANPLR